MSFVVGLTGGIGSGKTTVANLFARYGVDLIDADIIARDVVAPNSAGLAAIIDKFGADITLENGELDRAQLRQLIFSNPELKEWLNQLLHPMIRQQMLAQIQASTSPYCLLIVPLMVENNLQALTQRLLVVDVDEQVQIQRTQQRDKVPLEQVKKILASQASRSERLAAADDVITNNDDEQALYSQVEKLHQYYLALSQSQ
ncbi:dephospho-CoA kinase [Photobacterium damselae subsp. damselae]|uniref:dephospho-CoA kinase n=1 Tax=Photobacterium damselae TaxID=38293 RepID=UPI001EEEB72A|nr:dephospho-CoA kinase [Photobacterium damselae]UJZ94234.1 dephospho-CoA kinase [Photobacterium damselae subsp. damselae]UJZ98216.1 dephospho-CoA kinase [Photobacterium damselae subsp. damselae]